MDEEKKSLAVGPQDQEQEQEELFGATPTLGERWPHDTQKLENGTDSDGHWATAAGEWNASTNFNLHTGTNKKYTADSVRKPKEDWDGITDMSFDVDAGHILSANCYLNTYYTDQTRYNKAIIQGIATHEVGHSVGLGHATVGAQSVMVPYTFNKNGTLARTYNSPQPEDIEAVNSIYPTLASPAEETQGCECNADRPVVVRLCASFAFGYETAEELFEAADLVIEGSVPNLAAGTRFEEQDLYHTYKTAVPVAVERVHKGNADLATQQIEVLQMGGEHGNVQVVGCHTQPLLPGQQVLLYLKEIDATQHQYRVINESEGHYLQHEQGFIHAKTEKLHARAELLPQA